jgi:hypothetical protein
MSDVGSKVVTICTSRVDSYLPNGMTVWEPNFGGFIYSTSLTINGQEQGDACLDLSKLLGKSSGSSLQVTNIAQFKDLIIVTEGAIDIQYDQNNFVIYANQNVVMGGITYTSGKLSIKADHNIMVVKPIIAGDDFTLISQEGIENLSKISSKGFKHTVIKSKQLINFGELTAGSHSDITIGYLCNGCGPAGALLELLYSDSGALEFLDLVNKNGDYRSIAQNNYEWQVEYDQDKIEPSGMPTHQDL